MTRTLFVITATALILPSFAAHAQMVDSNPEPEIAVAAATELSPDHEDFVYGASSMVTNSIKDPDAELDDLGLTPPGSGGSIADFFSR